TRIEHGIIVAPGRASTVVYWKLLQGAPGTLMVRPFISGRDYHSLHRENPAFNFNAEIAGDRVILRPYEGVAAIVFVSNGEFARAPGWYRNFAYAQEKERGLDYREDLAVPGSFKFDLSRGEAALVISAQRHEPRLPYYRIRADEVRRRER